MTGGPAEKDRAHTCFKHSVSIGPSRERVMTKGLVMTNLSRRFGGLYAVRDFNLMVRPGIITGLIGPNGAGKTTVVNMITGLLRLDSGSIMLDGADISNCQPHELAAMGVARTFQNIRLLPEATVLENVMAGFYCHDRTWLVQKLCGLPAVRRQDSRFRERAMQLLGSFGLDGTANRLAGEIAYGHRRRVEIVRALAVEPKVLLLDEPVAGMNDVEGEDLAQSFRRLAQAGLAILLIEHNMRFVSGLCDDLCVLSSGEVIASGRPAAVLAAPTVIEAYLGA